MYKYSTYRIEIGGDYSGNVDMELHFHGGLTRDDDEAAYIISIARELENALKKLHATSKGQKEKTSETV